MMIKTQDLTGPALDWAVAKCEGLNAGVLTIDAQIGEHENIMRQRYSDAEWEEHLKVWNKHVLPTIKPQLVAFDNEGFPVGFPLHYDGKGHRIAYSTTWAQGGPIMGRKGISLSQIKGHPCRAYIGTPAQHDFAEFAPEGQPLVAAMRCYVASKLGDEVNIPEELL